MGKDTHVQNIPIVVNLIIYRICKFINLRKCKGINIYPIHKLVRVLKANILPFTPHLPYAYKHFKSVGQIELSIIYVQVWQSGKRGKTLNFAIRIANINS